MGQHEPRVRGTLADAAVGHNVIGGCQPLLSQVDGIELGPAPERPVLGGSAGPRHRPGARDVAPAHRTLLRVVGHVQQFAGELAGGADVDQRLADVDQDIVLEGADRRVAARHNGVVHCGRRWHLAGHLTPLGNPFGPAAIEKPYIRVSEEGEDPECVGSPPVALVAVDDHGGIPADSALAEQLGEALAVDVIAHHRVVEVEVPVDLDRPGDVAGVVEKHVLVGLEQHHIVSADRSLVQLTSKPVGRDQTFRVRVVREPAAVVGSHSHDGHLFLVSRAIRQFHALFVVNHTLRIMIPRCLVVLEIGRTDPFVIGLRHER